MSKSTNKKDSLLKAAKELFGEYGYAETTFKKISDRAGVALGLLTHHYGSKEKLFLASGLDVLARFQDFLERSVENAPDGYSGVMRFCKAYLDFSIDKDSNWLVLVRCSPYSDMKTKTDRDLMDARFTLIHDILIDQLRRGVEDGSLGIDNPVATAQVVISLLVGVNRTHVLTPYESNHLYSDALDFVSRAIKTQ